MRIGNVEIKNNIALAPMACHFDFYARSRAVGLCVQRWSVPKQCCITIRIQKT